VWALLFIANSADASHLSGAVYTGVEVHRDGLGDEWTCGMTLASAYVLRRLSATWLQLQMKGKKSEWM